MSISWSTLVSATPWPATVWFYRTSGGAEIDLVVEFASHETWAVEIKRSLAPKVTRGFHTACADLTPARRSWCTRGTSGFRWHEASKRSGSWNSRPCSPSEPTRRSRTERELRPGGFSSSRSPGSAARSIAWSKANARSPLANTGLAPDASVEMDSCGIRVALGRRRSKRTAQRSAGQALGRSDRESAPWHGIGMCRVKADDRGTRRWHRHLS